MAAGPRWPWMAIAAMSQNPSENPDGTTTVKAGEWMFTLW